MEEMARMKDISVLVVDDEEIVVVGWQEELKSLGCSVRTAVSGKEAVEMAKAEKPDIVFTDLVMPEMDGVQVCREIKEMYPDTQVVFVSGHPTEIERHLMDFLAAGGRDELLRKPLLEDEILKTTEKIVKEIL